MPRMTNTYMLPGKSTPEEIIASVKKGIYAVNFGGGQVDITSGKFVFSASEAYLIEDGKITVPVKGATLIGNGPDVLTRVSMVGNDLQLDTGIGVCGKDGQSVPVGVGVLWANITSVGVGVLVGVSVPVGVGVKVPVGVGVFVGVRKGVVFRESLLKTAVH